MNSRGLPFRAHKAAPPGPRRRGGAAALPSAGGSAGGRPPGPGAAASPPPPPSSITVRPAPRYPSAAAPEPGRAGAASHRGSRTARAPARTPLREPLRCLFGGGFFLVFFFFFFFVFFKKALKGEISIIGQFHLPDLIRKKGSECPSLLSYGQTI